MTVTGETLLDYHDELLSIARLQGKTGGLTMKAADAAGKMSGSAVATLGGITPEAVQSALEQVFTRLLDASSFANGFTPVRRAPIMLNKIGSTLSGAAGGAFGLAGVLPDILSSTTLIYNSIQKIAMKHGFDPEDPEIRLECVEVFGSGAPGEDEPGQSYVFTKVAVNGATVTGILNRVSARFASVILSKLGAQAVPVVGAFTGAAINYAFMSHYEKLAEIRFRLLRLKRDYPDRDMMTDYRAALAQVKPRPRRST